MLRYVAVRVTVLFPMMLAISVLTFVLIQLPPGDYLTSVIMNLAESGEKIDDVLIASLKQRYGLDQPMYIQYLKWMRNILFYGDFGRSFYWNRPVSDLIWERLGWTAAISVGSILLTWVIAFPVGIYSATHQYSAGDYVFTFLGFMGRATPNFLIALVLMWLGYIWFGLSMGGLFSAEFERAPWSFAKFIDLLEHLWVPLVVVGTGGTAGLIRTMRANLLDELKRNYVQTARAKGVAERRLIWKYPVRLALNPFVSTIGGIFPALISGSSIVSVVLSLPTTGPMLLRALMTQDMYLAGGFLMMLTFMSLLGTLVSDILLAALDPRIRQTV